MIRHLNGSPDLPLTLKADSTNIVKWWIDGAYAVHPDCQIQTGGTVSLGKGSIISTSTNQNINTHSSTETELVAADDLMPHVCWTNYFLDFQGYNIDSTIMFQDNQSAILLENNGRSPGPRELNI